MKTADLTAEEIAGRYWRGFRFIQAGYYVVLALYLLFLWEMATGPLGDSRWWFLIYILSLALFLICLRLVRLGNSVHGLGLERILNRDCDAVKYAEVYRLLLGRMKRNTETAKLNEARGLFFSGRFREAAALLDEVQLKKPGLSQKLVYQNIAFNCCLRLGDGRRAEELRRETERLLEKERPGKALRKSGEMLLTLMDAGLAFQREDYEAFRRLEAELEGLYTEPLQRVAAAYRLALADLAQGEAEKARSRLDMVVKQGGTLDCAKDARRLLAELA